MNHSIEQLVKVRVSANFLLADQWRDKQPLLRISYYPGQGNPRSWILWPAFESPSRLADRPASLEELTWDQIHDTNRFMDPMAGLKFGLTLAPTMRTRKVDLTDEQLNWIQDGLDQLTVPLKADNSINIGWITHFELEIFSNIQVRARWHDKDFAGWGAVSKWHERTREKFAELLSTDT